jgi:putative Ca2+/H+ antiporter (TMEM165/GDT1 family)
MNVAVVLTAFVPLLLLELPDKTFVATLVLSTRYRPLLAWVGVGLAFGAQCLIAVAAGGLLARLPDTPVAVAAAVLFAAGAVILWRAAGRDPAPAESPTTTDARPTDAEAGAGSTDAEARPVDAGTVHKGVSGVRAVVASFGVVFVAEWGDLSQLFTAGLSARYADPVSVFVGAWAALLTVSALAALAGRVLAGRLRPAVIRRVGSVVCAVLAVVTAAEVTGLIG